MPRLPKQCPPAGGNGRLRDGDTSVVGTVVVQAESPWAGKVMSGPSDRCVAAHRKGRYREVKGKLGLPGNVW